MAKEKKRTIIDAHESNAGTDFHILWSVQKCIELLNFRTDGLKSITIESLDPFDAKQVDPTGGALLGVDLTEYYTHPTFKQASKVVICQLKYSTKQSSKEWTAFSISQGKKTGTAGSIIDRLAATFKSLVEVHGIEAVLKKTKIKLISNRPASSLLTVLATRAGELLVSNPNGATIALLKNKSQLEEIRAIDKLYTAFALSSKLFIQFLSLFDFSDCNTDSRLELKLNAIKSLADLGAFDADDQLANLESLIRSKTMPEAKANNKITKENILYCFKFPDLESMFPVPPSFENLNKTVEREQLLEIQQLIINASSSIPICLHGVAGIGKSTISRQLPSILPEGSETILFDCYGGGTYLDSNDKRHLHQKALLFLSNEMALKTGCPFLLNRNGDKDFYLTEFSRRVKLASTLLLKRNKSALLAIIIDAADNSITAALEQHEKSFVHDLVTMSFPENVRMILTSRSHRVDSLNFTNGYTSLLLNPFTNTECKTFLKLRMPKTVFGDNEVNEFNMLTNGIPRVMAFTLENPGSTLKVKLKSLEPGGKNLDDIFANLLRVAERKSGDRALFKKTIRDAIALPRPIPIKYLILSSGTNTPFVKDIIYDLSKGIAIENNLIRFNNEDFETFLRDKYPIQDIDLDEIAEILKSLADSEDYASTYLGRFLTSSGKINELESIVLNREYIKYPVDSVRNREVFIERARLAMQNTVATSNNINYLKLQIVAAEASKVNSVLEDLMIRKPELSSVFGNGDSNNQMYFKKGNLNWFGRVHLRSAASFSRNPSTMNLAKKHMRNAEDWIEYRRELPEERRHEYKIDDQDIASGAEAVLRIVGPVEAMKWLFRWKPKPLIYHCIKPLIENLLSNSTPRQFKKWFQNITLRIDVALQINQICFENGYDPPLQIELIAKRVTRLFRIRQLIKPPFCESLISLVEQLSRKGFTHAKIKPIFKIFEITNPDNRPSFYADKSYDENRIQKTDIFFRLVALRAIYKKNLVNVEDLLPEKLKNIDNNLPYKEKEYLDQERKEFLTFYRHLLPIYLLIERAYNRQLTRKQIIKGVDNILVGYEKDFDISYYYRFESKHMTNFISVKLLDLAFLIPSPIDLVDHLQQKLQSKEIDNVNLLLSMAERLSLSPKLSVPILTLLNIADEKIINGTFSSSSQIDYYSRAAIAGSRIRKNTGKYYFDKVIEASKDIDQEAFEQIKAVKKIVQKTEKLQDPKLAFEFARYVEYCSVKLDGYEDFPWDSAYTAIGEIDPMSLLAISCRWDHRNRQDVNKHYPKMLLPSIQKGEIDHLTAAALLPITTYYWDDYVKTTVEIIERFSKSTDFDFKTKFLRELVSDLKLRYNHPQKRKPVSAIIDILESSSFSNNSIYLEFKKHLKKIDEIILVKENEEKNHTSSKTFSGTRAKPKLNIKELDVTDANSIESFFSRNRRKDTENYEYDGNLRQGLEDMLSVIKPGQYIDHLNALLVISNKYLDFWTFESALEERLNAWNIDPEVRTWKKENFGNIIRSRFFGYVQLDDYYSDASIYKLARLCDVDDTEISKVIIEALPDKVNELSAPSLLRLLEITTLKLPTKEKIEFLNWLVPRWTDSIKPEFGDGMDFPAFIPPADKNICITRFLRYHLGHPDKRCRWRAAKALTRLVNYGKWEILEILLKEQNNFDCMPFQDPKNTFYWIAAKQWLWIVIHKLSAVNPSVIKKYAKQFYQEFSLTIIQHAQILYFVKHTCLKLENAFPKTFTKNEARVIEKCLTSTLAPISKEKHLGRNIGERVNLRFDFNILDTVEYWYGPLGAMFNMSGYEVADMVDNVICDQWGFSGKVRELNHVISSDHELMGHYKFDIPTIEDLSIYYEYNGMQCVAVELIKSKPLVEDPYHWNSWEEWVKNLGLVWDNVWLGDLKDPTPVDQLFWKGVSTRHPWQWNIQVKDFDHLIGLSNSLKDGFIVVASHAIIHYEKDYEQQTVVSALVDPKYAMASLRAMQTISPQDYHIPLEKDSDFNDDDDDDDENFTAQKNEAKINAPFKFQLIPWIQYIGAEHHGGDEFDEETYELDKKRYIMGDQFIKWAGLTLTDDKRLSAIAGNFNRPVTVLESWSNVLKKPSYSELDSHGQRLFLRVDQLLSFLENAGLLLIVNAEIYRHPETKEYDDDFSYYNMFYLIYPDGKVKTISRDFKLR